MNGWDKMNYDSSPNDISSAADVVAHSRTSGWNL